MKNLFIAIAIVFGLSLLFPSKVKAGETKMGDLNDDGYVTKEDIDMLVNYILGKPTGSPLPHEEFMRRADVSGNGAVSILDVTGIVRIIKGLDKPR